MATTDNEQGELFETDEVSVIQEGDELDAQGVVAVSYTHLTLPTT